MFVKKGDKVKVITGKDKNKKGVFLTTFPNCSLYPLDPFPHRPKLRFAWASMSEYSKKSRVKQVC
ncbi:hypothetical protein N5D_19900 [Enterococcus faecalis]|nr:hypothetical protein N5D_19900 [Enterococcus faecalis]